MFNTTQKIKAWAPRILIKNQGWTQVLRNDKHFLLHKWRPSCYSSKKKRWYARDGCEALGFHSCAFILYLIYGFMKKWIYLLFLSFILAVSTLDGQIWNRFQQLFTSRVFYIIAIAITNKRKIQLIKYTISKDSFCP